MEKAHGSIFQTCSSTLNWKQSCAKLADWSGDFMLDADREHFFELMESERVQQAYHHTPSTACPKKGQTNDGM